MALYHSNIKTMIVTTAGNTKYRKGEFYFNAQSKLNQSRAVVLFRGDFFGESDPGIKPVLLYGKFKPYTRKVTF